MARNFTRASGDYLQRPGAIVSGYPFTFGCWAAPVSTAGNIFSSGNTSTNVNWLRLYNGTNSLSFSMSTTTEGYVSLSVAIPGYTLGQWLHAACVAASATNRKIYANGVEIGSSSTLVSWPPGMNVTSLGVLQRDSRVEHFDGALAHAAFWSAALSPAEIASLASGASPLAIASSFLVSYWPLYGRACDSPERDVYRGNNMTVAGTAWDDDPIPRVWSPGFQIQGGQPWYAPVAVPAGPQVSVSVSPETASVYPLGTVQFTAIVAVGVLGVTWSVQSGGGSIDSSGFYTAPSSAGSATIRATSVDDPTKYDEAVVTINSQTPGDSSTSLSPSGMGPGWL